MTVRVERDDRIASVVIDRPEAGNRLDGTTLTRLADELTALADDPDGSSVVVLRAAGPDFSRGREPGTRTVTPSALTEEFGRVQRLNEVVQRSPLVTIAAVQGVVRGAGLSLASRCDLVVAGAGARLSFPEVRDGIPATIVLGHYRYVLPRKILLDLILTGREISAEDGLRAGLVSRVVPDGEVEPASLALGQQIAAHDPRTLRTIKEFLVRTEGMDPRDAPGYGIALLANELVDRALTADGDDGS